MILLVMNACLMLQPRFHPVLGFCPTSASAPKDFSRPTLLN